VSCECSGSVFLNLGERSLPSHGRTDSPFVSPSLFTLLLFELLNQFLNFINLETQLDLLS